MASRKGQTVSTSKVEQLALLKDLLAPEAARDLDAGDLGAILPEAIMEESARGDRLGRALQPTVEDAIEVSVNRNPQVLVDAIFPVIGPAIKKAVASSLRSMTDNLNSLIENSFSVKAVRWRFEAKRTGRPFAELVLLKSLLYRVEQAYLIHAETGLCVAKTSTPNTLIDPDTMSGMLSAIQRFVRESLDRGDLRTLQVGDRTSVWIERGQDVALAIVIFGNPPQELRETLQTALKNIQEIAGQRFRDYVGDPDPVLDSIEPYLEDTLESDTLSNAKGGNAKRSALWPALLIGALLILSVVYLFHLRGRKEVWNSIQTRLDETPGVMVLELEERDGKLWIDGLRDPLSDDPISVIESFELESDDYQMRWRPIRSEEPEIALRRVLHRLEPAEGLQFSLDGSTLLVKGPVAEAWVKTHTDRILMMDEVSDVRVTFGQPAEQSVEGVPSGGSEVGQ